MEGEGAFLACSFWYADTLIMLGRRDQAVDLFEICSHCATTWVCCPRNTIPPRAALSAFPAGLFACGADQYGAQPLGMAEAGGTQRSCRKRET